MDNTYTTITLSNECYLYKVRLETGRLWLTGDGRIWWQAGASIPDTQFSRTRDIVAIIKRLLRFRSLPAEMELLLNQILSWRHLRRIPLGAEYHYIITYTNGGITIKRRLNTDKRWLEQWH